MMVMRMLAEMWFVCALPPKKVRTTNLAANHVQKRRKKKRRKKKRRKNCHYRDLKTSVIKFDGERGKRPSMLLSNASSSQGNDLLRIDAQSLKLPAQLTTCSLMR